MGLNNLARKLLTYSLILAGLISLISLSGATVTLAQTGNPFVRRVRALEAGETGIPNPAGLAFSARARAFYVVEARGQGQPPPAETEIIQVTPLSDRVGSARIAAAIRDPINMAFDSRFHRLLIFQSPNNMLIEVREDADGHLDPTTLVRHDARYFGLQNPQGMAVDPASGQLFILDASGPRIIGVEPEPDGSFDNAVISVVDLQSTDLVDPRGLAFDPTTGHLHVVNPAEQELYELSQTGQLVTTRNLSEFGLGDPRGMVFAPSGDQTDDPLEMSLYLADSGLGARGQGHGGGLPRGGQIDSQSNLLSGFQTYLPLIMGSSGRNEGNDAVEASAVTQSSGDIVELSFTQLTAAAASTFQSSLIQTVDLAAISPPSPDSSGLAYVAANNTLMMDDGEVEETVNGITHFQGANVWELTLSGSVVNTANISKVAPTVVPMTNEPTGIAWNPSNGHFYVTQDDGDAVFDWNIGGDGQIGTSDDSWTSFSTAGAGNGDAEGIAFDSWNNHLFVADGINMEVYEYTLSGSLVGQFDVEQHGVADPESVEFNPVSGTLFVMSSNRSSPVIIETTTSGDLLQTIDISATGARAAAGLAYAPASDGSGAQRFYIVDRGIDNNTDPDIIDGKMYELTAPSPSTPGNLPPSVDAGPDQSITLPDVAILDGTVSDDGIPDPPGAVTSTWSQVSGPGVVTFGDASALDTTASFSNAGSYVLRLTASDGEFTPSDEVIITVEPDPSVPVLEVRVAASSDDAEEAASGGMTLGSSDLQLVYNGSNQTVGMRFNGIDIPQGSTIVRAYVQFQVDETNSEATSLSVQGEAVDNALTFASGSGNISSRPKTTAAVSWSPAPWTTAGEAGFDQQTPDIASVVQEIVTRPGWASGNSLVIIITGTGHRTAESFDGDQSGAPLLHVEYTSSGNHNPGVTINTPATGSTFNDGNSIPFGGTASDFEDGDLTASLAWESNLDGPIGTGGSFSRSDLSVGVHTITATVTDSGGLTGFDTATVTVFAPTNILVGAGDIADDAQRDEATATLLETIPGTVVTLGDNAYPNGTEAEYNDYYDPTWGRHKARTQPATGNHEYDTGTASAYFNYFGAVAGDPTKGYYSFDVDTWHIIVLNTECSQVGGCGISDPQGLWLQADLAANLGTCTLAIMHRPLFTSSSTASSAGQDFWTLLYQAEADVVLSGHAHYYERFAPQDPNGVADPVNGIREFVVGTGGGSLHNFGTIAPNSEVRDNNTWGVLKLTLQPTSYDWEFIPIAGQTFTDAGSASCVSLSSFNNPPLAVDDAYTTDEDTPLNVAAPGVLANDMDAGSDPLTAVLDVGPANGTLTLNPDGSFTYTPNADFNGLDTFSYHASDGTAGSNLATVSLTVNPVNDAPVTVDDAYTTDQDTPLSVSAPGVLANDTDTESDPLTAVLGVGPANGTLTLNSDGSFTYTPNADFNGADSFTYRANDGQTNSNIATVSITVNPVNDPPTALDDAYATHAGRPLNVAAPGVLANDTDTESDPLTAVLNTPPSSGSLTLNSDGSFTYTPAPGFAGTDSFTYRANAGQADSNLATVSISVNSIRTYLPLILR
jgi:VCBS repeat-containing protein